MMLSGIEWRNCDTCPRRFAALRGVVRHTCPDCEADSRAVERRSKEHQRWHAEEAKTARKGGRPLKYKTASERLRAERQQNAKRQRAFRAVQRNGKPSQSLTETKDLQARKSPLSAISLTPLFPALETAPNERQAGQ
jgi:hypothetical protein